MPRSLPERPRLEQLREQARDRQRAVRHGEAADLPADPSYSLDRARRAVAREYGFADWARLRSHVEQIERLTWVRPEPPSGRDADGEPPAHRLLRSACLTWTGPGPDLGTAAVLAADPSVASSSVAAAAVCAAPAVLATLLDGDPGAASRRADPYGWSPLMYQAYARLPGQPEGAVLSCARLLLDAGADPDDGRYVDGWPTPFTVLTGVIGGGEEAQAPHPHVLPFARLLLGAGADPNDAQALYNRMFTTGDDWLELLLEFGAGRGDGGPWRRRLPDLTDDPAGLLRSLLAWAVTHDQHDRVALLARGGVDVLAPLTRSGLLSTPATPLELALRHGHGDVADLLRGLGAVEPVLPPPEAFVAAVMGERFGDFPAEVVAAVRSSRPGLVVWAAAQRRARAVEWLVAAGWDVNALARSDVPLEQPWQTALHTAVEKDDAGLVRVLLRLGADRTIRDARFDGTPAQWADHLDRPDLLPLLE